jgi:hypothetical protein
MHYNAGMRFTLGKMFLTVAMLALACAGMKYRNEWWTVGIAGLTLLVFATAVLKALAAAGRQRAMLLGFCIVGFGYALIAVNSSGSLSEWLPTRIPLAAAAYGLQIPIEIPGGSAPFRLARPAAFDFYLRSGVPGDSYGYDLKIFLFIGHCVFSWLFAVLAAWFAGRMYDRRERATEAT